MQKFNKRDKAIHQYIECWDNGNIDGIIEVLELASYDPELERIIEEINLAFQEEEGITDIATDAEIVRDLIQQHLHSAFEKIDNSQEKLAADSFNKSAASPLTVGDVAKRLLKSKSLRKSEYELAQNLIDNSVLIPSSPSLKAIKQLFVKELQQDASSRFLDRFRQVAIKLGMGRSYNNIQLAAARQHQKNYKSSHK